jgi:hypothetical protein
MGITSSISNQTEETLDQLFNSAQNPINWINKFPLDNKVIKYNPEITGVKLEDIFMLKTSQLNYIIDNLHKTHSLVSYSYDTPIEEYGVFDYGIVGIKSEKLGKKVGMAIQIRCICNDKRFIICFPLNSILATTTNQQVFKFSGEKVYNRSIIGANIEFVSSYPHLDFTFNPEELSNLIINYIQRHSQVPYDLEIIDYKCKIKLVPRETIIIPSLQREYEIANEYTRHIYLEDINNSETTIGEETTIGTETLEIDRINFEPETQEFIRKRRN